MLPAPPIITAAGAPQRPIEGGVALLVVSFFIGVPSFLAFVNCSPMDNSSLWSLSALVGAYCIGFVSSLRLMGSGKQWLIALGLVALPLQSSVMFLALAAVDGLNP